MQRYFLTAESTYEALRQGLNTQLAYPNALGKSVFQTALYAPRDGFRRILLAVDTDLPNYAAIATAIAPLLESDAMEELDEATYLAAVASATAGVASWNELTDKPSTFTPSAHTHTASAITDFTAAVVAAAPPTTDASLLTTGTLSASRLPSTTVSAGSYGSASSVATFTVGADGRLTAAGSSSIAIAAGAVSGLAAVATSGSASDLSAGTVADSRLTARARAAMHLYLWSTFR